MKQPELGKKISELRLAKGLTQGQLAEMCHLSLRTIQRIEAAEVMPRSYTIKLIFESLDYNIYDSFGKLSYTLDRMAYRIKIWLGQFYTYVLDLFDLKTNTMKKLTILSVPCVSVILLFVLMGLETKAQDNEAVQSVLSEANANFVSWFNSGQIDSIGTMYLEKSHMVPDNYQRLQGRDKIVAYYRFLYDAGFRFTQNQSEFITVSGTLAVDRGSWNAITNTKLSGAYITQWRFIDGTWYIESELTNSYAKGANMK